MAVFGRHRGGRPKRSRPVRLSAFRTSAVAGRGFFFCLRFSGMLSGVLRDHGGVLTTRPIRW